jgi:hypothetical protein
LPLSDENIESLETNPLKKQLLNSSENGIVSVSEVMFVNIFLYLIKICFDVAGIKSK